MMSKLRTSIRLICVTILSIFLLIFLPPTIIFLLLPGALVRYFVSISARLLQPPGLGKMLTALSVSHAIKEDWSTIVVPMILQGEPDLDKIKAEFSTKVVYAKDESNGGGGLLYPELTQTVVSWMGFLFWKDVPNFKLPITCHKSLTCGQLETPIGRAFLISMAEKKWDFGSEVLWDFTIIPGDGQFAFIGRWHHALTDGISAIIMLDELNSPKMLDIIKTKISKRSSSIIFRYFGVFRMPWDLAKYLEVSIRNWSTPDIFNVGPSVLKNSLTFESIKPLEFEKLKNMAGSGSFTGALISVITTGIRNQVLKRDGIVEGNIILHMNLPDANHSRKLRNAVMIGYIELPIKESDPAERIRQIESQLASLKKSTFCIFTSWMGRLWNCQFPFIVKWTMASASGTKTVLSLISLPFNRVPFNMLDHPFLRMHRTPIVGAAGTRVVPILLVRNGKDANLGFAGDSGILKPNVATALLDEIVSEIHTRLGAGNNDDGQQCRVGLECLVDSTI